MGWSWTRGRTIGHGATAAVSAATSRCSGEIFAVKSAGLAQSECLQRENKIHATLDCPHIIGYRGCDVSFEDGRSVFNLMMKYAPGGSLVDEILRSGGGLCEAAIRDYTGQVVRGLEHLHSRGIVHCDIKGSNILLSKDGGAKIADFGCAKEVDEAAIGGTPVFMSPEVARGEEQGFPADIWALGCTVIEMSTGKLPWPNAASTLRRIAFSGELPEFPARLSELGKDFLSKCLRIDPKQRWTAKELLQHPFLGDFRVSNFKQSPENRGSPTSILDQGIWSSIEEDFSDEMKSHDFSEYPMRRIKELTTVSETEDWDCTESWITVRDSKYVNFNLNCRGKFREQSLVIRKNPSFRRFTEELVSDEDHFL